ARVARRRAGRGDRRGATRAREHAAARALGDGRVVVGAGGREEERGEDEREAPHGDRDHASPPRASRPREPVVASAPMHRNALRAAVGPLVLAARGAAAAAGCGGSSGPAATPEAPPPSAPTPATSAATPEGEGAGKAAPDKAGPVAVPTT